MTQIINMQELVNDEKIASILGQAKSYLMLAKATRLIHYLVAARSCVSKAKKLKGSL